MFLSFWARNLFAHLRRLTSCWVDKMEPLEKDMIYLVPVRTGTGMCQSTRNETIPSGQRQESRRLLWTSHHFLVTAFALKLRRRAARRLGRAAMNSDLMGSYCGFSAGYLGDHRRATVTAREMQLSVNLSHLSICFFVVSNANIVIPYYGGSFRIMYYYYY
jgi:hypothetical protein